MTSINTKPERPPQLVVDVLYQAWNEPYSTKSDYARMFATEIAAAASMGLLTTRMISNVYSNQWRITDHGMTVLRQEGLF